MRELIHVILEFWDDILQKEKQEYVYLIGLPEKGSIITYSSSDGKVYRRRVSGVEQFVTENPKDIPEVTVRLERL